MQPFHWLLAHNHVIPKYKRPVYFLQIVFLLIFSSMIVSVYQWDREWRQMISENQRAQFFTWIFSEISNVNYYVEGGINLKNWPLIGQQKEWTGHFTQGKRWWSSKVGKVRLEQPLVMFTRSKKECGRDRTTSFAITSRHERIGIGKVVKSFLQACSENDTEPVIAIDLQSKSLVGGWRRYVEPWSSIHWPQFQRRLNSCWKISKTIWSFRTPVRYRFALRLLSMVMIWSTWLQILTSR